MKISRNKARTRATVEMPEEHVRIEKIARYDKLIRFASTALASGE